MQIKFLTETWFGFYNLDITDKAVNVAFPHSYSPVLRTDNTSCTCLQCYYVIFEKVFALTELLHILKMEAASTSKILVPTPWTAYSHLPKKSITKRQTLESHIMHKTSVSRIPFSLSTLVSSFAGVITTVLSIDLRLKMSKLPQTNPLYILQFY